MADPGTFKTSQGIGNGRFEYFAYHGRDVEILEMNTAVVWWQVETFELPTNLEMSRCAHCHNPSYNFISVVQFDFVW